MPGSIHLPGWVGLLLERRRTGLRVESLTPWQSSVSAGIHCCTNPYHAERNGVNFIWRSRSLPPAIFAPSGATNNKLHQRHVSAQTQRLAAGPPTLTGMDFRRLAIQSFADASKRVSMN
jgi:hypothetical protein